MAVAAAVFAVWRVAEMVALEEGPFSIFVRLQTRFNQRTWVGRGLRCTWCVSFWAGAVAAIWLAYWDYVPWALSPVYWFALSGASCMLHVVKERLQKK